MKIKSLPIEERPREKAKRYGINTLSNAELLAIILGSGNRITNVLQLATNLLSEMGGIHGLFEASYYSFKEINGIKEAKALMLASIGELYKRREMKSGDKIQIGDVIHKYQELLKDDHQEKVIILPSLNLVNPISEKVLYIGTDKRSNVSFKDIIREVFAHKAKAFYLIHTHPTGFSIPSVEDVMVTKFIKNESLKMGIRLLDHFLVGLDGFSSVLEFIDLDKN